VRENEALLDSDRPRTLISDHLRQVFPGNNEMLTHFMPSHPQQQCNAACSDSPPSQLIVDCILYVFLLFDAVAARKSRTCLWYRLAPPPLPAFCYRSREGTPRSLQLSDPRCPNAGISHGSLHLSLSKSSQTINSRNHSSHWRIPCFH